jgi:hypothetical protein
MDSHHAVSPEDEVDGGYGAKVIAVIAISRESIHDLQVFQVEFSDKVALDYVPLYSPEAKGQLLKVSPISSPILDMY